jgi:hypothetical protein
VHGYNIGSRLSSTAPPWDTNDRSKCRNRRCRAKLPVPVSNPRDAFCSRGCFDSFYLRHCLVCEAPIKQAKRGRRRLICRKSKCRSAFRHNYCTGRYVLSSAAINSSEVPGSIGPKPPLKPDRVWRLVAGPELSPTALHCATLGGEDAVDVVNRTNLKHWRNAEALHGGRR